MMAKNHPRRGGYDVDEDFKKYVAAIYWVPKPSTIWVTKWWYNHGDIVNTYMGIYN